MSLELALNPSIRPAFVTATNAVIPLVNIHAPHLLQNILNLINNFHLFFAIVSCAYILSTIIDKIIYYH
jgi:hypothetical protein